MIGVLCVIYGVEFVVFDGVGEVVMVLYYDYVY